MFKLVQKKTRELAGINRYIIMLFVLYRNSTNTKKDSTR